MNIPSVPSCYCRRRMACTLQTIQCPTACPLLRWGAIQHTIVFEYHCLTHMPVHCIQIADRRGKHEFNLVNRYGMTLHEEQVCTSVVSFLCVYAIWPSNLILIGTTYAWHSTLSFLLLFFLTFTNWSMLLKIRHNFDNYNFNCLGRPSLLNRAVLNYRKRSLKDDLCRVGSLGVAKSQFQCVYPLCRVARVWILCDSFESESSCNEKSIFRKWPF